jgi:hypothetical protein
MAVAAVVMYWRIIAWLLFVLLAWGMTDHAEA